MGKVISVANQKGGVGNNDSKFKYITSQKRKKSIINRH